MTSAFSWENSVSFCLLLLLMLLSCFSRVLLCVTPETAGHQAPLSLRFSRQEHWSGLPFPSPMHESGKWNVKVKLLSHVWLLATPWTTAYQPPPSMGFAREEYWSGLPLPSPIKKTKKRITCLILESTGFGWLWALAWRSNDVTGWHHTFSSSQAYSILVPFSGRFFSPWV